MEQNNILKHKMLVKTHKINEKTLVAVCDEDLVGRVFEENGLVLDVKRTFYDGEIKSEIEIGDLIRNADQVHLVGEKSIKLALDEELITTKEIKLVGGIPHSQIILIHD